MTFGISAKTLADALRSLTAILEAAVQKYDQAPNPELEFAARKWQNTALRLLLADLHSLDAALAVPGSAKSVQTFLAVGTNETGLAKNLDSFRFDFAGAVFEKQLNEEVDTTVKPPPRWSAASPPSDHGEGRQGEAPVAWVCASW